MQTFAFNTRRRFWSRGCAPELEVSKLRPAPTHRVTWVSSTRRLALRALACAKAAEQRQTIIVFELAIAATAAQAPPVVLAHYSPSPIRTPTVWCLRCQALRVGTALPAQRPPVLTHADRLSHLRSGCLRHLLFPVAGCFSLQ